MFKIPKVADSFSVSRDFCDPPTSESIEESRDFYWNVEAAVSTTMSFTYWIGEGPLYWFRIDWYPSPCSQTCQSFTPIISYIEYPNCPYEIIESCIILPPTCSCTPSCQPGECISTTVEVWHMLATSVPHLCERINTECCPSKPKGYIRRVQQYMRPALCCDVANNAGSDEYKDVDFINCECGNLVDPCIAKIIYPCHINQCGIHGPVASEAEIPLVTDVLNYEFIPLAVTDSSPALEIIYPKEKPQINNIMTRFGAAIPMIITCKNNLGDYLKNKDLENISLFYNKDHKSWVGSKNTKDIRINLEFSLIEDGDLKDMGYKINMLIDKNNLKTKVNLIFKSKEISNKGNFEIDLKLNNQFAVINPKKATLQSKILKDDIGIFNKNPKYDLNIKLLNRDI